MCPGRPTRNKPIKVHWLWEQTYYQAKIKLLMVLSDPNAAKWWCQQMIALRIVFLIYRSRSQRWSSVLTKV
jgi:hypothetical protein